MEQVSNDLPASSLASVLAKKLSITGIIFPLIFVVPALVVTVILFETPCFIVQQQ